MAVRVPPPSAMSVRLDPAQRFQQVLGFGAALTDASCYLLEQLDAGKRKSILDECFGPSGLRLSVARTTIGSSDYSLNAYSYDDTGVSPIRNSRTSASSTINSTSFRCSVRPSKRTPRSSTSPLPGVLPAG